MYECLCGSRPTEADTVGQVLKRIMKADFPPIATRCEGLPDDVASMITRMLSADRETRPRDVREVRDVLARHAAARLVSFAGSPREEPVDPRGETHPVSGPSAEGLEIEPRAVATDPGREDTHRTSAQSISFAGPRLRRNKGVVAIAAVALITGVVAVLALRGEHRETGPAVAAAPSEAPKSEAKPTTLAEVPPVVASVGPAVSASAPLPLASPPTRALATARAPTAASAPPRRPLGSGAASVTPTPSSVWTER